MIVEVYHQHDCIYWFQVVLSLIEGHKGTSNQAQRARYPNIAINLILNDCGGHMVQLLSHFARVALYGDQRSGPSKIVQESEDWDSIHGMSCLCSSMKAEHYIVLSPQANKPLARMLRPAILQTTPCSTCRDVKEDRPNQIKSSWHCPHTKDGLSPTGHPCPIPFHFQKSHLHPQAHIPGWLRHNPHPSLE